jgi:hypothetical protein
VQATGADTDVEDWIARTVAAAPPLTTRQVERLRNLLAPTTASLGEREPVQQRQEAA